MWIIEWTARMLILALGWGLPYQYEIDDFRISPNVKTAGVVLLFSHTSHWDLFYLVLYRLAYPIFTFYVVMKPQPFERWGWFLRRVGCLQATKREEGGGGFVEKAVQFLEKESNWYLLISPEGTLKRNPWRSGYFFLAQKLNCSIRVIGFDYEVKRLVRSPLIDPPGVTPLELYEAKLKRYMSDIVPRNVDQSFVRIRKFNESDTTPFDFVMVTNVMTAIVAGYLGYQTGWLSFALIIISGLVSSIYHYNREQDAFIQKVDFILVIVAAVVTMIQRYEMITITQMVLGLLTFVCYSKGCGRRCDQSREYHYVIWHSLYHLTILSIIMTMLNTSV